MIMSSAKKFTGSNSNDEGKGVEGRERWDEDGVFDEIHRL